MAIDPTAPLTPVTPAAPAGSQPNSVVLQAMARAALASATNTLGELVGQPATDASKSRQGVEQADKASTRDAGHAAVSPSPGGATAASAPRPPPQETRLMRAVRIAATDAVPRQAGLAPLMADVRVVLDRPDTPPAVRMAAETLMARLPRAFEISTPRGLRKAVEQSGVFLEARLARSDPSSLEGEAPPAALDTDLKAALLVFKGALGRWLAQQAPPAVEEPERAESFVEPSSEPGEPGEPSGAEEAVKSPPVTAPRPETEDATPVALPPAQDALTEEPERLASTPTAAKPPPPLPEEEDAPSLARPVPSPPASGEDDVEPRFAAFLAPLKSTPPTQVARPVSPVLGLLGLEEASPAPDERQAPPPTTAAPLAARGYGGAVAEPGRPKTPPPPFADGPMAGQRPSISELPGRFAPDEIVRRLLKGASAALARQDLMQIASLGEVHHDPDTAEVRPQAARLNLDVPFVTPQGVAVAQFEITRDGGGAGGTMVGPVERTYRARFSIDVEPLGPVHALVTLTGSRARVSLWAERAETIARLRAGEESLGAALRQAELTPEVAVHSGAPPVRDASALGHFVDQAS